MKITKLEVQKKDPTRANLFIDDKFAMGLRLEDVLKYNLAVGDELDQATYDKILKESGFGKLFEAVLRFLSFRPRSESEIRRFLAKKKAANETIENIILKLRKMGQINDLEFAKWFVEQRRLFKPKGILAIKFELRKLGVDRIIIDKVVTSDKTSEEEVAFGLAEKKLAKIKGRYSDQTRLKQSLQAFLAMRGFSYETSYSVIARLFKKE